MGGGLCSVCVSSDVLESRSGGGGSCVATGVDNFPALSELIERNPICTELLNT